jgi:hypothetical protein
LAVIATASQGDGSDFDLAETAGTLRVWHLADGLPADSVAAILETGLQGRGAPNTLAIRPAVVMRREGCCGSFDTWLLLG